MTLKITSRAQFNALVEALDQYVTNTEEALYYAEQEDTPELIEARAYLDQLNGVRASMAEEAA